METNPTKTWQVILGLLVLAAIIILIVKTPKAETPMPGDDDSSVTENPNVDATQLCYIWNTEAGDKAQLSIDIRGKNVTGELNWLQAEKDKKTGIFSGTISEVDLDTLDYTINAIWQTEAEGVKVPEELRIILNGDIAKPGFGEMVDRGDGTYVYAHPESLSYEPNLSQTDCGDAAMD